MVCMAPLQAGEVLREAIERHLGELESLSEQELRDQRYRKFRAMGRVLTAGTTENDLAV